MALARLGRSLLGPTRALRRLSSGSGPGANADVALVQRWEDRLSAPTASEEGDAEEVAALLHTVIRLRRDAPQSTIPDTLCLAFIKHYKQQDHEARIALLRRLATEFGGPSADIGAATTRYQQAAARVQALQDPDGDVTGMSSRTSVYAELGTPLHATPATQAMADAEVALQAAARSLSEAACPLHSHLLAPLSSQPGGIATLVAMRADALHAQRERPARGAALRALAEALRGQLSALFGPGLLRVTRVSWDDTPAAVLERVMQAEAVHVMSSWEQLRSRLGPRRRVYAVMHPSLPDVPLAVVHTALMPQVPACMKAVLQEPHADQPPVDPAVAVFYSISNSQPGLAGIDMGNFLIKKAAKQLGAEFPVKTYVTLSPIPGFAAWLDRKLASAPDDLAMHAGEEALLRSALPGDAWLNQSDVEAELKPLLLRLCAHYLLREKRRGLILDPVAGFHIRNGAECWRLNWRADASPAGLARSHGIMVNYLYDLSRVDGNNRAYVVGGTIAAGEQVTALLPEA